MSKKLERAVNGPGWGEVIFGAVLSFLLGVVLGATLLIVRPVAQVREMPKEADVVKGTIYYIEGSRDSSKARQALAKRKLFVEGQSVTLTEDEVNSLVPAPVAAAPAPAAPKAGEKKDAKAAEAPAAAASDMLASGTPNVRIRNGVMQVGVPVTLNIVGLAQKVILQARGVFEKQGDRFVFVPAELYVGSCPVQRVPFLSGYVRNKFLAAQPIPEDIVSAWPKLKDVAIEGNALKLAM